MKPTGPQKEKFEAALFRALDKVERLELELKDLSKDKREEIKEAKAEVKRNRDLLAGREHEEDELPFPEPDHAGKPRARGAGLAVALADNGFGVPPHEVEAAREELRRKGKAKGMKVPDPLSWTRKGEAHVAEVEGATYRIEPRGHGSFVLLWRSGKTSKNLGFHPTVEVAQATAWQHHLDAAVDEAIDVTPPGKRKALPPKRDEARP